MNVNTKSHNKKILKQNENIKIQLRKKFSNELTENELYTKVEMENYALKEYENLIRKQSNKTVKNQNFRGNKKELIDQILSELIVMQNALIKEKERIQKRKNGIEGKFSIRKSISKCLREYQIEGIKFMMNSLNENAGCILAHYMGTGKTLEVITLLDILFKSKSVKKVIIAMPKSDIFSWKGHFEKWSQNEYCIIDSISSKNDEIFYWHTTGGVLLINYEKLKFRLKPNSIYKPILNTTDLLILDEGHIIKNSSTKLFKRLNQIRTRKRIILSGTPIVNSLIEFKNLIDFVRPNLLGPTSLFNDTINSRIKSFMFDKSNIGKKCIDEKKIWDLTDHFVYRLDKNILDKEMFLYHIKQQKEFNIKIYEIGIKLEEKQKQMATEYVENYCKNGFQNLFFISKNKTFKSSKIKCNKLNENESDYEEEEDDDKKSSKFFNDINIFHLISSHPFALMFKKYPGCVDYVDNFFNNDFMNNKVKKKNSNFNDYIKYCIQNEYIMQNEMLDYKQSKKLVFLNEILKICVKNNEKLVIFSVFKATLDLIEIYFRKSVFNAQNGKKWTRCNEFYRIDSNITDINVRKKYIEDFQTKALSKVILISKVGSESIDLTRANHCVLWEPDWNNSSTIQAVHRLYRYGQQKDIHVYKFFAEGIENMKYKKQLMKQCLSDRILDKKDVFCENHHDSFKKYYESQTFENLLKSKNSYKKHVDEIVTNKLVFYFKSRMIYEYKNEFKKSNDCFKHFEINNYGILEEVYESGSLAKDRIMNSLSVKKRKHAPEDCNDKNTNSKKIKLSH